MIVDNNLNKVSRLNTNRITLCIIIMYKYQEMSVILVYNTSILYFIIMFY
jgi:hypothetical protein